VDGEERVEVARPEWAEQESVRLDGVGWFQNPAPLLPNLTTMLACPISEDQAVDAGTFPA
jgi:hypothetical protein